MALNKSDLTKTRNFIEFPEGNPTYEFAILHPRTFQIKLIKADRIND